MVCTTSLKIGAWRGPEADFRECPTSKISVPGTFMGHSGPPTPSRGKPMTLYRYDGDAPTIYKDKTIYPGQEVDLQDDDERILCAEHRMVESKNTDGPVSFGEDTDDKAPERDEDASDVNLEALGKAILNEGDYDDVRDFVNGNLREDGEDYIRGKDAVFARLTEFVGE